MHRVSFYRIAPIQLPTIGDLHMNALKRFTHILTPIGWILATFLAFSLIATGVIALLLSFPDPQNPISHFPPATAESDKTACCCCSCRPSDGEDLP